MPKFRVSYTYDAPTDMYPNAIVKGAVEIQDATGDKAGLSVTGSMDHEKAKNFRINSITEIEDE